MSVLWWSVALQTGVASRARQLLIMVPGGRGSLLWIVAAALALAALASALLLWRRRQVADHEPTSMPPLVFPAAPASRPRVVRSVGATPPTTRPSAEAPTAVSVSSSARIANGAGEAPERAVSEPASAPQPALSVPEPLASGDSLVDGRTVRFYRPSDGTLQILPGRLEIVDGADQGQSIRFVQTGNTAEVTFGRSDGPPYRHVQLRAPTVSRQHARMVYEESTWRILNLSKTNPVVVNGEEMGRRGDARRLQDGDRIEMGEVTFLFRAR